MSIGNILAAGAAGLSVVTALIGGAVAGWGQVAAFALAAAAAVAGARGAAAFAALSLALATWFATEAGANALIGAFGLSTRAFWRDWALTAHILGAAAVALVFWVGLSRRGPTVAAAAVEAADDIETVVTGIGKVASFLFLPMMVIIFYDVTQRWIINRSPGFLESAFYLQSAKMQEMQWHLHGALLMLCLGFAYVKDAHVRIELVRDKMSPRARVWMELLGAALFLFAYCAVLVRFGVTFAERSFLSGEASAAPTGLTNRWIIKTALPVGFVVLAMSGVAAVLRCLVYLFGPDSLKPLSSRYAGTHHADLPDDVALKGPITD